MSASRPVTCRPYAAADLPAVGRIVCAVSRVDGWPLPADALTCADAQQWVTGRAALSRHVAVSGAEVVGYAITYTLSPDDPSAAALVRATGRPVRQMVGLGALVVHPDQRRQGVGAALVRDRLRAVDRDRDTVVLATLHQDGGFPATYRRFGASRVGQARTADGRPVALWAWADRLPGRTAGPR